MKTIELTLWVNFGGGDGDNYEDVFEITDQDYDTIIRLLKEYLVETDPNSEGNIDGQKFTEEVLYERAREIYDKLSEDTSQHTIASIKENMEDDFDEEEEGCSLDEYIENFSWGFYISDDYIKRVI